MGDDMAAVGERPPSMARMLLDRVAIAADTRLAWILADFAILCAGTATTTVHPATPAADVAFVLDDADARIVFAGDDQVAKLRAHRADLPQLEKVVTFDGTPDGDWAIGLADLERLGRDRPQVRALIASSLEETNHRLGRWETIKRFAVLRCELTVEDGDLTPSLELKRRAVTAKHRDLLDALDEGGSAATPHPPPPPARTSSRGHDGPLDRG